MLCRVADSLFWMSRYIERAENTVRLVDVNLQLLLETDGANEETIATFWRPIIESTGDMPLYKKRHENYESQSVMEFLTFDRDNPSSLIACVGAARENARMIRDQISEDMWEVINRLYLMLKRTDPKKIWRSGPYNFYKEVREYSNLFQGYTASTYPRETGYDFIMVGKYLERADKTGRILRAKLLMDDYWSKREDNNPLDLAQWVAILRACSAEEAFQQTFSRDIVARDVIEFLALSRTFPRSMLFCLLRLQMHTHAISECPLTHFSNEAERQCGKLISRMNYSSIDEILEEGLASFLAELHKIIDQIAIELNNQYMFFPIVDPAKEEALPSNVQASSQS